MEKRFDLADYIIEKAQEGDAEAIERVVKFYLKPAQKLLASKSCSEEFMHFEASTAILRCLGSFDFNKGITFSSYLRVILTNRASSLKRDKNRKKRVLERSMLSLDKIREEPNHSITQHPPQISNWTDENLMLSLEHECTELQMLIIDALLVGDSKEEICERVNLSSEEYTEAIEQIKPILLELLKD